MAQEEVKFPEGSRIMPINPASKYVILLPKEVNPEYIDLLAEYLTNWWHDENPFLIMTDEIILVDVSKADVIGEESNVEEK